MSEEGAGPNLTKIQAGDENATPPNEPVRQQDAGTAFPVRGTWVHSKMLARRRVLCLAG